MISVQDAYVSPHKKAYVVNIVRAVHGNNLKQRHEFGMFLGAFEQLKDRFLKDWRNMCEGRQTSEDANIV